LKSGGIFPLNCRNRFSIVSLPGFFLTLKTRSSAIATKARRMAMR
jgi:hypothetical protein